MCDTATTLEEAKRVLWVFAHPEPASLNGHLRDEGVARLRRAGRSVVESDLYRMAWDPLLRGDGLTVPGARFDATADSRRAFVDGRQSTAVAVEQAKIRAADVIVLQFPLWWYSMPAILKGWFDRVFVSGFAFGKDPHTGRRLRFEQGPFVGKRALVVVTLGDREAAIGPRGKSGELHELLFGLLHGTLAYTGMSVLPPLAIPSADFIDDSRFRRAVSYLDRRLDDLFSDAPLRYRPQFQGDYSREWALKPAIRPTETGLSIHLLSDNESTTNSSERNEGV